MAAGVASFSSGGIIEGGVASDAEGAFADDAIVRGAPAGSTDAPWCWEQAEGEEMEPSSCASWFVCSVFSEKGSVFSEKGLAARRGRLFVH